MSNNISKKSDTPPVSYIKEAHGEWTPSMVYEALNHTVKADKTTVLNLFYRGIATFSNDDQWNIAQAGPSCSGKTYLTKEVFNFFPQDIVEYKGTTSPTAFFHENKKLCVRKEGKIVEIQPLSEYVKTGMDEWLKDNSKPTRGEITEWKTDRALHLRKLKDEWRSMEKFYVMDLERKIIVFLDQPDDELLKKLRPVLSHDQKEILVSITGKEEGAHKTKHVLIIGYATFIFCSVLFSVDEQERSRFTILSPDVSQIKIRSALDLQAKKLGDKNGFIKELDEIPERRALYWKVWEVSQSPIDNVVISIELMEEAKNLYIGNRVNLMPRDLRDFPAFISMIKACAMFNQWGREKVDDHTVKAHSIDVDYALEVMDDILLSNAYGLPPMLCKFWDEKLKPFLTMDDGVGYALNTDISKLYRDMYQHRLSERMRRNWVDLLIETGLIYKDKHPENARLNAYYLIEDDNILHEGGGRNSKNIPQDGLYSYVNREDIET